MEPISSSSSTGLARPDEFFTDAETVALAGFLAEYSGLTRDAYTLDLRQFATWRSSACAGATSSALPDTSRPWGGPEPPSPGVWAPSPASTATPRRRVSSSTHRPCTCAVPASTTSLMS